MNPYTYSFSKMYSMQSLQSESQISKNEFYLMDYYGNKRFGAKRKNPPVDLNHEVLILQCNALNLMSIGSHVTLAERLFDFYNTGRSQQPQLSSGEPISTSLITSLALSSHVGYPLPSVILSTSTASINYPLCHHRKACIASS